MLETFHLIIERDTYNSILYAILGGLLLLSIFNLALFFQKSGKPYLFYGLYTFFSFLAYMTVTESGLLFDLSNYFGFDYHSKQLFTIIFNCLYFLFFTSLLKIKEINKNWYKIIVFPIYFFIATTLIGFSLLKWGNIEFLFVNFYKVFVFLITIQIIISFYILSKVKNNLKYYIIFGGVFLYICSMAGEHAIRDLPFLNITKKMGDFIFYIGLIVENIAFSFALGERQRIVFREKANFNNNLVAEMQKNDELKDKINLQNQKRLLVENEKIKFEQEISDLKLSILQTQMNPHFIFNALNSIKYYILENDTENAVNYLTKFSKIIRTILVSSTVKEFTLEEELHTIKVYVDIENLRFKKEIDFNVFIDDQLNVENIKLPPMVLQPFIENAILHGVALVDNKKISLEVLSKKTHIEIRIIDNGVGRKQAEKNRIQHKILRKSLGTKIADGMLKNYFGAESFKIKYHDLHENDKPSGTMVILEIPMV